MSPLAQYLCEALKVMNPVFAPTGNVATLRYECYAQLRRLWDRGIPVGMGVGHVVIHPMGDLLQFTRISDDGLTAGVMALVAFANEVNKESALDALMLAKAEELILVWEGEETEALFGMTVIIWNPTTHTVTIR